MENRMQPQTSGGNSSTLVITNMYPADQYNLLVPIQTVAEISSVYKPVMNVVRISTNLKDNEIYEIERARKAWRDRDGGYHEGTPAKYALTKKGLAKLMRAAGIKVLSSKPVIPSTCQKCIMMNQSIGDSVNCSSCSNKDVKYEVRVSVPQLTGENTEIVAHKEVIVDDVTAGMSDKQKAEFMKYRSEMCESKALNRALRTAMLIKGSYQIEEFQKPFVVAYLVPNLDNPEVRKEAVTTFFGETSRLFGGVQTPLLPERSETVSEAVTVADQREEPVEPEKVPEAPTPQARTQPVERKPEPQRIPEPQRRVQAQQGSQTQPQETFACSKCGKRITERVYRFSMQHYKASLCMKCQNETPGTWEG